MLSHHRKPHELGAVRGSVASVLLPESVGSFPSPSAHGCWRAVVGRVMSVTRSCTQSCRPPNAALSAGGVDSALAVRGLCCVRVLTLGDVLVHAMCGWIDWVGLVTVALYDARGCCLSLPVAGLTRPGHIVHPSIFSVHISRGSMQSEQARLVLVCVLSVGLQQAMLANGLGRLAVQRLKNAWG